MRYWWVNQNQTFQQEVNGGYLWSPKRNSNGARNPFYESMREVSPGDLIFSFVNTRILAIGTARSYCYENPKPTEFGEVGSNWDAIGWRVSIAFRKLNVNVRPKDHMQVLRPFLPNRYSPLQANGNGVQSIYLTEVPEIMAEALIGLIGSEASVFLDTSAVNSINALFGAEQTAYADLELWEHRLESTVDRDPDLAETSRQALIIARRSQGPFKDRVMQIEHKCRITNVENPAHLRASHCKPWRNCNNSERLNGENGLLLTPSIDHLFDRGFIGFENSGTLIISPVAHQPSLQRVGIDITRAVNVGGFTEGQTAFLEYDRTAVLLKAIR